MSELLSKASDVGLFEENLTYSLEVHVSGETKEVEREIRSASDDVSIVF